VIDGLILGVIQRDVQLHLQPHVPLPFCIPDEVTRGQVVRVVIKYIDQHPEQTHELFGFLAYDALKEAWPCKPDKADK
jgi:Rap1a immunity proteins